MQAFLVAQTVEVTTVPRLEEGISVLTAEVSPPLLASLCSWQGELGPEEGGC